jgi:FkbM family methyltransferase
MVVARRVRQGEIFEKDLSEAVVLDLNKHHHPVFVDIGCNVGFITTYVASLVPRVKIYAFEPGPHQRSLFEKTLSANPELKRAVSFFPIALASEKGSAKFVSHFTQDSSGDGFLDTGRAGEGKIINVPTTTLDIWWQESKYPNVNVIKIDTEGSELIILKAGEELLKRCRPTIYLEIHKKNLEPYQYNHLDILLWFQGRNYSIFSTKGIICTEKNIDTELKKSDSFVARPN